MKKRLLAFVCMVVVALGIFAVVATNAKATGSDVTYKVGYAKVDITPWENPSDPDSIDLIPINTAGYGSSYYADNLIDSNGDGKTDRKDGIFATCTVLTEFIDGNEGTTLVFISMDALNGYGPFIKDIRKAVVPALVTSNSKVNIADSQIFVSGSHCHTAPNFRNLSTSEDEAEAAYYNRVVNEIKDNVVEAYEKKADATISRSTIDVAQYYGYDMNYIRHYENTNYSGDYYGSNFGLELPSGSDWANQHIASADSTMEMVKFTVAGQDPIMLVNWRAHPDNVGARNNYLSPDYVGALRYRMENNVALTGDNTKENYRVSFIQGASGNINAMSLKTASKNQWFNVDTKNPKVQFTDTKGTGNIAVPFVRYGYLLAGAALYADETQQWTPVYGEIRSLRTQYTYATNSYTDAEIAAANAAKNLDGDDFPYHYSYQGKKVTIDTSAHRDKILQYGKGGTPHLTELNTILIGDSLSFVTAPGELFDRYDSAGSVTADSSTTGWGSLNRYGEPIVMGYTNGDMGYFPNTASYDYNIDNSARAGIGSYEAQTSNFAKGTGEELISAYKNMLDWTKGMTTECEHCGETVTFEPIAQGTFGTSWGEKPPAGHYYLAENVTSNSLIVSPNTEICLHLNGNSLKKLASGSDAGELLYIGTSTGASGAVLNVMDYPENSGIIQSKNRPMTVYGTLNLYGGTIQTSATAALSNGETVYITSGGIVNQRGGIIRGGMTNGGGAAVNVYTGATAKSQFNMYGGRVEGGTAAYGAAINSANSMVSLNGGTVTSGILTGTQGRCVRLGGTSELSISGNPVIDHVYFDAAQNTLKLTGSFLGEVGDCIQFNALTMSEGFVLGTAVNGADMSAATVKVEGKETDGPTYYLGVNGSGQLIATTVDPVKVVGWIGETPYVTEGDESVADVLDTMLHNYDISSNEVIKLNKDIEDTYTFEEDVYLDLNGREAAVSVANGRTLYVMDSGNDSYDSRKCGTVIGSGNIQAVPENSTVMGAKEGFYSAYLKKDEGNNTYSFHRVDVGIVASHTSPEKQGIRYECGFYGDEFVAGQVKQYGVAVSIKGDPVSGNDLTDDAKTTTFTPDNGFGGNSSYITGILKESNGFAVNKRNAAMPIYGRAYVLLNDESYWFGDMTETSLQSAYQEINEMWGPNTLQALKDQTFDLYAKFRSVMKSWDIDNIVADAEANR